MCIRDRATIALPRSGPFRRRQGFTGVGFAQPNPNNSNNTCLLYTSEAADERSSVDLGGRRIIKKKNTQVSHNMLANNKQNT